MAELRPAMPRRTAARVVRLAVLPAMEARRAWPVVLHPRLVLRVCLVGSRYRAVAVAVAVHRPVLVWRARLALDTARVVVAAVDPETATATAPAPVALVALGTAS